MKLYFMKQEALNYMKANMNILYKNYYKENTPDWIYNLFDYDPFQEFMEVKDFSLADISQKAGVVDFQNCKILYSNLKGLSDSAAGDERLWAGLCNKNFYPYMRRRWKESKQHLRKTADDAMFIQSRYFYKSSGRSGMFRNTLSRCWWTGRLTYSEKYTNHWELLDAIGPEDLISKVSDIFYSNTYANNSTVIGGFCQGLKYFRDKGIYISNRDHIRPTAQYLNAVGGGVLLDMFTEEEIKDLVVDYMGKLVKGVDTGVSESLDDQEEERIDDETEE